MIIGIITGFLAKNYYGGSIISLVTGLVVGLIVHEVYKYFWFN